MESIEQNMILKHLLEHENVPKFFKYGMPKIKTPFLCFLYHAQGETVSRKSPVIMITNLVNCTLHSYVITKISK